MKESWLVYVSLSFTLLLSACLATPQHSNNSASGDDGVSQYDRNANSVVNKLDSCGSRSELFNTSPIALPDLTNIVPLGNLNPPSHTFPTDHVYFFIRKQGENAARVPLFSIGGARIFRVSSSERKSADAGPFIDYSIEFAPCREVRLKFGHVSSLSEKLNQILRAGEPMECEEYSTGGHDFKYCSHGIDVKIEAGELIGTAGGPGENALDVWAFDLRTTELAYANPARFYTDQRHISCPVDYFTGELRQNLTALLGDGRSRRTVEPVCGEVEQDAPGTAQGVWFFEGTKETYPEDAHLALVHDNFDPSRGVFSVGTSTAASGLAAGTYYFSPLHSGLVNRDFGEVRPDGMTYCYEPRERFSDTRTSGMIILIQLVNERELLIERQESASCAPARNLTNKHSKFER
ncbi:hypothetical protein HYS54_04895 [Candidatus Micrarchaeota archaeon]|nr:hypothetical protein [Candidatus Micrarchaeota archaeon]